MCVLVFFVDGLFFVYLFVCLERVYTLKGRSFSACLIVCVCVCVCVFQLWDLTAGKMITEFTSHTAAVNIVQFHPNEYLLASGSADRYVHPSFLFSCSSLRI